MTIAACYVSPEGVVFGSDSTTTVVGAPNPQTGAAEAHYFNFGQKVFEIGNGGTLGVVTWGLGGFPDISYRTLFAELADELKKSRPASVELAAKKWAVKFWTVYDRLLGSAYRKALAAAPNKEERAKVQALARNNEVGFCLGGIALPRRQPSAYEMLFSVNGKGAPTPKPLPSGQAAFRGVPMFLDRMLYGIDPYLFDNIVGSGKWTGNENDLLNLVQPFFLGQPPRLPLREAIDWVYSSIQSTIKAVKFSPLSPMCGGPVEIAVVTSDRPFRWVRHKSLDAALSEAATETHQEAL